MPRRKPAVARRVGFSLVGLCLCAVTLLLATTQGGLADYDDDNVLEWGVFNNRMGFQQGMISGTPITACSDGDFVSSTQIAVSRWNTALGHTSFQNSCAWPQVWVTTELFEHCQPSGPYYPHACTEPTNVLDWEIVSPTAARMNPNMFPKSSPGVPKWVLRR